MNRVQTININLNKKNELKLNRYIPTQFSINIYEYTMYKNIDYLKENNNLYGVMIVIQATRYRTVLRCKKIIPWAGHGRSHRIIKQVLKW